MFNLYFTPDPVHYCGCEKATAIGGTVQKLVFGNKSHHLGVFGCSRDLCEDASCQISFWWNRKDPAFCSSAPFRAKTQILHQMQRYKAYWGEMIIDMDIHKGGKSNFRNNFDGTFPHGGEPPNRWILWLRFLKPSLIWASTAWFQTMPCWSTKQGPALILTLSSLKFEERS